MARPLTEEESWMLRNKDFCIEVLRHQLCVAYNLPYNVLFGGGKKMEPWKERFIEEHNQLRDRVLRLDRMLQKWETGKLDFTPKCPKRMLKHQLEVMIEYLYILRDRAEIEGIELEKENAPYFCYECRHGFVTTDLDGNKEFECTYYHRPKDPFYCGDFER